MNAWYLLGPEQLELRDVPTPEPGVGQALVRVRAVGICGSDVEAFAARHPLPNYPRLPGHEFAGEIAAVGPDWSGLPVGARVSVDPAQSCGACYACRVGRHNCCANVSIAGVHRPGAMAEYVVCDADHLVPIPETMSFDTAAIVEMLSIGWQATTRAKIVPGDFVVVLGAGPIGLSCAMLARRAGAHVLVSEPLPWRRVRAAELGAVRARSNGGALGRGRGRLHLRCRCQRRLRCHRRSGLRGGRLLFGRLGGAGGALDLSQRTDQDLTRGNWCGRS